MNIAVSEFSKAAGTYGEYRDGLTREAWRLYAKRVIEELLEMGVTVTDVETAKEDLVAIVVLEQKAETRTDLSETERKAEQLDALVDVQYTTEEMACRMALDLKPAAEVVHEANMRKANPVTGLFERNAEGKITKPKGWVKPNIVDVLPLCQLPHPP